MEMPVHPTDPVQYTSQYVARAREVRIWAPSCETIRFTNIKFVRRETAWDLVTTYRSYRYQRQSLNRHRQHSITHTHTSHWHIHGMIHLRWVVAWDAEF